MAYLDSRWILHQAKEAGWGALPEGENAQRRLAWELIEEFGADTIKRSGFLRRDMSRFQFGAHRLLMPWTKPDGTIQTVQRRTIVPSDDPKTPNYVFPKGRAASRSQWPYLIPEQVQAASKDSPVFVTEGAIDALSLGAFLRMFPEKFAETLKRFKCQGRPIVVATGSATLFPEKLRELTGNRVVFCAFDSDPAGQKGTERLITFLNIGPDTPKATRQCNVEKAKDWNERLLTSVAMPHELDDDLKGCR
jgi:DNA primase